MSYEINCDDGVTITGETIDELLDRAEEHVRDAHPELAESFGREQLRAMAHVV